MHAYLRKRWLAIVLAGSGARTMADRCLIAAAVGRLRCRDRRRIWHACLIPVGFDARD
jgi:hypothetical protein